MSTVICYWYIDIIISRYLLKILLSSTPYTKSFLCLYSNKSKKEIYLWKSQHYKHCVSKKYQSGILIDDLVFLKLNFSAICFVYEKFYLPVLPDKLLLCHRATLPWQFSKKIKTFLKNCWSNSAFFKGTSQKVLLWCKISRKISWWPT